MDALILCLEKEIKRAIFLFFLKLEINHSKWLYLRRQLRYEKLQTFKPDRALEARVPLILLPLIPINQTGKTLRNLVEIDTMNLLIPPQSLLEQTLVIWLLIHELF